MEYILTETISGNPCSVIGGSSPIGGTTKMTSLSDKASKTVLALAGAAGSIAAITALLTTIFGWETSKVTAVVSTIVAVMFVSGHAIDKAANKMNENLDNKLAGIKEDIAKNEEAAQARSRIHDRSLCRLELSDLMINDPDNVTAIRKKARHYFCDLDGNDWMGDRYSGWATKYDKGDLSILNCENELKNN